MSLESQFNPTSFIHSFILYRGQGCGESGSWMGHQSIAMHHAHTHSNIHSHLEATLSWSTYQHGFGRWEEIREATQAHDQIRDPGGIAYNLFIA